jgi:NTP pyrophosphatase (non-canonical NTP hydrolase)
MEFDHEKITNTLSLLSKDSSFDEIYAHLKWSRKYSGRGKQDTFSARLDELESEVCEARAAFESGDKNHLAEELGDVLWDLMFLLVFCEEESISVEKIVKDRIAKQVRRLPCVYEPREVNFEEEKKIFKVRKNLEKEGKLVGIGF